MHEVIRDLVFRVYSLPHLHFTQHSQLKYEESIQKIMRIIWMHIDRGSWFYLPPLRGPMKVTK